jgi:hypothetical protein
MINFDAKTRKALIELASKNHLYLEGNIIKVVASNDDEEFSKYLTNALALDKENRRKRLDVTKQIQEQNKKLIKTQEENTKLMSDLQVALEEAQTAKQAVESDLDILQKRTQFELVGFIVKVALWIIMGVGITTTLLYSLALFSKLDTTLLGSTWSNMFSILLTNSFSIIGTIMGVKYATEKSEK